MQMKINYCMYLCNSNVLLGITFLYRYNTNIPPDEVLARQKQLFVLERLYLLTRLHDRIF